MHDETVAQYHFSAAPSQSIPSDAAHAIAQLFWITYRKRMPPLYRSQLTSDAGWGCMIRTAQMMLAHAFQRYFYGDGWREAGSEMQNIHDSILSMFVDDPSAVFSIHRIVERGTALGKRVGEWYGPNTISAVITELVNECHRHNHGSSFACCNFDSQMVSIQSVWKAASSSLGAHASPDVWASSVMIFVPVRLGLDSLNPEYHTAVLRLIEMPSSLGIIGGSPRHSLYFIGRRKERMLYLDPHTTQACIGVPATPSSIANFDRTELSRSRSDPQASELADARWGDGSPLQPPTPTQAARQPPAILRSSSSSIAQHSPTRNAITSSYSKLSELVSSSIAYLAGGPADGGTAPAVPCPLTVRTRLGLSAAACCVGYILIMLVVALSEVDACIWAEFTAHLSKWTHLVLTQFCWLAAGRQSWNIPSQPAGTDSCVPPGPIHGAWLFLQTICRFHSIL